MFDTKERKSHIEETEEVKAIFEMLAKEIPALIKNILASVFSEEAGRNMGKAAAAFYKELKESGIPEDVAVKMTEDYIRVFTGLSDLLKRAVSSGRGREEIEKGIKKKLAEKEPGEEKEEEE